MEDEKFISRIRLDNTVYEIEDEYVRCILQDISDKSDREDITSGLTPSQE